MRRNLLVGPLRTLDAGCGSGAFTIYAAKMGNDSLGISFDEAKNRKAERRAKLLGVENARFLAADLRELDKLSDKLGKFDQIICFETIEHIKNDKKLLSDLAALLKSGGRLLLTTPSAKHKPLLGDRLSTEENGGHVRWGYTHEALRRLFEECGLQVVEEDFISGFVSQQITNAARLLGKVNNRLAWAATFPLRILRPLDHLLTRLLDYPYMCVAVVGVKRD